MVLVTGGGAGVGRGIAQAVLGAGGSVAIADRDPDALAACLAEWQLGERALAVRMDVSDGDSVAAGMAQVLALRASGRGAVVNIASTRAHQSEPHSEAYAAAKGGLLAFTHALAVSEGPRVRVNCISPGWIATEAWRGPARRRRPKLSRRDHGQHPAGRVGTPEDIATLAVWLLAPALSGFVTGQEFIADGGMGRKMQYA